MRLEYARSQPRAFYDFASCKLTPPLTQRAASSFGSHTCRKLIRRGGAGEHGLIPAEIIAKKRDGGQLTDAEIADFVQGFSNGQFADYQASALAMAICIRGMNVDETVSLTRQMLASGLVLDWGSSAPKVDKHSTGGLGDKVSIVLAPAWLVVAPRCR